MTLALAHRAAMPPPGHRGWPSSPVPAMPPTDPAASSSPACVRRRAGAHAQLAFCSRRVANSVRPRPIVLRATPVATDVAAIPALASGFRLTGRDQPTSALVKKRRQRYEPGPDCCNRRSPADAIAPTRPVAPHHAVRVRSLRISGRADSSHGDPISAISSPSVLSLAFRNSGGEAKSLEDSI